MENMDDIKQVFFTECAELLADMEERLLKLDVAVQDLDQLNAIFRCAHSIKGGAGAFGLNEVMQFTHVLEALLDGMREGRQSPTVEAVDLLLKSVDIVGQMLNADKEGRSVPANLGADIQAKLVALTQGPGGAKIATIPSVQAAAAEVDNIYTIAFTPSPDMFASGDEPLLIMRELKRLGAMEVVTDLGKLSALNSFDPTQCVLSWVITLRSHAPLEAVQDVFEFVQHISDVQITQAERVVAPAHGSEQHASEPHPAEKKGEDAKGKAATSIRVDLEKIDRLVNMVGELVITEAMLRAQMRNLGDQSSQMFQGLDELSHHTRELQEAVMAVRMQPVKSIFSRMPRIVRDTSAILGKDIQLVLSGENTEVDKTVIEQLSDPLTHMIRNSIDHGIEKPDERVWADKPAQGTINLSASHRSGRIIIEIRDDGAGINRQRVLGKAQEKGLVPQDAQLTDEEIDHLIFLPGFSTAEKVTNVSGRGVGMDVVRRNIEGLGGNVRITNMPGKGSIFTVSLPLTLAILDGMIVRVGAENYIIPITSIIETLRPKPEEIHRVEGRSDVINVRGEFVSVVYLHRIFNVHAAESDLSKALIVLVECGTEKMGLVVDELVGQQQVVIKSLEANADPVKGISGATILGDGKVSLILEIEEVRELCHTPKPAKPIVQAA